MSDLSISRSFNVFTFKSYANEIQEELNVRVFVLIEVICILHSVHSLPALIQAYIPIRVNAVVLPGFSVRVGRGDVSTLSGVQGQSPVWYGSWEEAPRSQIHNLQLSKYRTLIK